MRLMPFARHYAWVFVIAIRANVCFGQSDAPLELTWAAPRDCPQELEVQQQLRASVGPPSGEQIGPFQADGTIEPSGDHYRLTLLIERGATHGTRVIESEDCRSLAKAATIVLALLVQKERALGRELSGSEISGQPELSLAPDDTGTRGPAQTAPPSVEPQKPRPLPLEAGSPSPWHLLLRAPEGRIDFNALPRLGYGIGVSGGVAYQAWRGFIT